MKSITYLFMLIASIVCSSAYASSTEVDYVTPVADVNGSLNGKSLIWYDELGLAYRFWFRVSGLTATDPTQSGEANIPVDISQNASIVDIMYAMEYPTLNPLENNPYVNRFGVEPVCHDEDPLGDPYVLMFTTFYEGEVQDMVDVDTGFAIEMMLQGSN